MPADGTTSGTLISFTPMGRGFVYQVAMVIASFLLQLSRYIVSRPRKYLDDILVGCIDEASHELV